LREQSEPDVSDGVSGGRNWAETHVTVSAEN